MAKCGVDHDGQVEVAVADMADDGREQRPGGDIPPRFGNAFGQSADGHTDVGGPELAAGLNGLHRIDHHVPRIP